MSNSATPPALRRFTVVTRTGRNSESVEVIAIDRERAIMCAFTPKEISRRVRIGRYIPIRDDGPATPAEIATWVANYDAKAAALAGLATCTDHAELKTRMDEIDAMP